MGKQSKRARSTRRETMIRGFLFGIFFAVGASTTALLAVVPHTFSAGDPISASKMNENFAAIDPQFSTTETATHMRWIDGKTIYRKVVNLGAVPNTSTTNTAHGIAYQTVISLNAMGVQGTDFLPFPGVSSGGAELRINTTNITLTTFSAAYVGYNAVAVVEYTK